MTSRSSTLRATNRARYRRWNLVVVFDRLNPREEHLCELKEKAPMSEASWCRLVVLPLSALRLRLSVIEPHAESE